MVSAPDFFSAAGTWSERSTRVVPIPIPALALEQRTSRKGINQAFLTRLLNKLQSFII
jgi:hypothetical protein